MVSGQMKKCPVCEGDLVAGSEVCPKCGTDVSLFQPASGGESSKGEVSRSLDEILASVLDEPKTKAMEKKDEADTLDELDLDLPDEPPSGPKLELDILEEDILGKEEKSITFQCPGCGAEVDEQASQCPSCGAFFAEEDSFRCPVCGSDVSVGDSTCPKCGVHFEDDSSSKGTATIPSEKLDPSEGLEPLHSPAESTGEAGVIGAEAGEVVRAVMARYESQRAENPMLVGDVANLQSSLQEQVGTIKSLVSLANRLHVPVENTQQAIVEATRKARARDLPRAVKLAWSARYSLEQSLALQVAQRLELMERDLKARRAKGRAFPVAEALLEEGIKKVEGGDVGASFEKLQLAEEDIASRSSGQSEAHYAIQTAEQFINEVGELRIEVVGVREVLQQGKEALRIGDWETASHLAAAAQQRAMEGLRQGIADEMKRARQVVMELKMRGHDVSRPIEMLKQASACTKEEGYAEAMRYLKMFKQQVQSF